MPLAPAQFPPRQDGRGVNTTSAGKQAESAAADYLLGRGFAILERNYRKPDCEIDIVARKGPCVYFVEVKYRARPGQGSGLDYVTAKKRRQMAYAASVWVSEHAWDGEMALSALEVSGSGFIVGEFIESIS